MKKKICSLLGVLISAVGFSQITITEVDLPEAGYTYMVGADTLTAVNLGTPSASPQVWDYSSLLQHYMKFPTYDSTVNTSYAAYFSSSTHYTYGPAAMYSGFYGGAPVGQQGMSNGYMFWRRDNTGFWIVGFRSDEGMFADRNVLYDQQELMVGTDATYGSVFTNTARWELFFGDNTLDFDTLFVNGVDKTLTADAFGELTTPGGNFPDVLRIHEYLVTTDSSYATLMGNPLVQLELNRDTLNNYIFMDNATNYPVCIVHADKNNVILSVEYYMYTTSVEIEENVSNPPNIYPNPTTGIITLSLPLNLITDESTIVVIRDLSGKIVLKKIVHNEKTNIDLNEDAGIYFYSIYNSDGIVDGGKILLTK